MQNGWDEKMIASLSDLMKENFDKCACNSAMEQKLMELTQGLHAAEAMQNGWDEKITASLSDLMKANFDKYACNSAMEQKLVELTQGHHAAEAMQNGRDEEFRQFADAGAAVEQRLSELTQSSEQIEQQTADAVEKVLHLGDLVMRDLDEKATLQQRFDELCGQYSDDSIATRAKFKELYQRGSTHDRMSEEYASKTIAMEQTLTKLNENINRLQSANDHTAIEQRLEEMSEYIDKFEKYTTDAENKLELVDNGQHLLAEKLSQHISETAAVAQGFQQDVAKCLEHNDDREWKMLELKACMDKMEERTADTVQSFHNQLADKLARCLDETANLEMRFNEQRLMHSRDADQLVAAKASLDTIAKLQSSYGDRWSDLQSSVADLISRVKEIEVEAEKVNCLAGLEKRVMSFQKRFVQELDVFTVRHQEEVFTRVTKQLGTERAVVEICISDLMQEVRTLESRLDKVAPKVVRDA
jgi:hypothetical protein